MQRKRDIAAAERWRWQFQPKSGMHPFGWKPRARHQLSAGKTRFRSSKRTVAGQFQLKIGHEPGRLEAQGHTAVQYRQNETLQQQNCSGGVSTQIGHALVRLEAQGQKQQFSAGRAILRSSRTVAGQCQIRSGMHPFGWKPPQPSLGRSEYQTRHI